MNPISKVLCLFASCAAITTPLLSLAGEREIGNGGDVVVCRNNDGSVKSIELLDFYEARIMRGLQIDLGDASLPLDEKVLMELHRLAQVSPKRSAKYAEEVHRFFSEGNFISGISLVDIPDSGHLAFPDGCKVEQIVIQQNPQFSEDRRYTINKDLYDLLDNNNKAGLAVHEVILKEAVEGGASNSIGTRYLNSYLASAKIDTLGEHQIFNLFQKLQFRYWETRGMALAIGSTRFHDNGSVSYSHLVEPTVLPVGHGQHGTFFGTIAFHPNGKLYYGYSSTPVPIFAQGKLVPARKNPESGFYVNLHENGETDSGYLAYPTEFMVQGQSILFAATHIYTGFYPDGTVHSGILAQPARLLREDGRYEKFKSGSVLLFNPDGRVKPLH
jgi:hypothetical protein